MKEIPCTKGDYECSRKGCAFKHGEGYDPRKNAMNKKDCTKEKVSGSCDNMQCDYKHRDGREKKRKQKRASTSSISTSDLTETS